MRALMQGVALGAVIAMTGAPMAVAQEREPTREETLAKMNGAVALAGGPLRLDPDFVANGSLQRSLDEAEGGWAAVIVELDAPLDADSRAELEGSGYALEEYLGGTIYMLALSPERRGDAGALAERIISGAMLDPEAKIRPAARRDPLAGVDLPEEAEKPEPTLSVSFLHAVGAERAMAMLKEQGVEIVSQLSMSTFVVRADPGDADTLARIPGVKLVDAGPTPFLPLNATARRVSGADQAQGFSLPGAAPDYAGVTGAGIRIAIADSGVDQSHDDFDTVTSAGAAGASRVYNPRAGSGGHGTHVASIAAGSGVNSAGAGRPAFSIRGQAPEAMVGDYGQMAAFPDRYHAAIVDDGTDVSNHSYVQSFDGYGSEAAAIDDIVRGVAVNSDGEAIPARPQVWAAGNNGSSSQYGNEEGYYSLFTSAKNTISVGSVDSLDRRVSDFSSLGPTFDGRIKPDVVAPGCNDSITNTPRILAARNNSQDYTGKCGTSMAAPVVSGIIALMMEAYENETALNPAALYPSLYKAILVQTARDMVKLAPFPDREFDNPDTEDPLLYHAGPDFATGYGLVDADAAVRAIAGLPLWKQAMVASSGEVDTYCMVIPEGASEIKATLAWDDEPGSTVAAITTSRLVNDLDLELVAPDGTIHRPWTLDPLPVSANPGDGAQDPISAPAPARRDVDRRNNVEMANVAYPEAGEWKVRVRAFNLPNGEAQPYALAASGALSSVCSIGPIIVVQICVRFPWVCQPRFDHDGVFKPVIPVDWRRPVDVDEICKYVLNCPGCERVGPNGLCPGWEIDMAGLPPDARITVFDEAGRIVKAARGARASIAFDERRPGSDRYMIVTGADGGPLRKPIRPKMSMRLIDRR